MINHLIYLFKYFPRKFKIQFNIYILSSIFSGLLDGISIGLIVPYLKIIETGRFQFSFLDVTNDLYLTKGWATFYFILIISINGIIRFYQLRFNTHLSFSLGNFLSKEIFNNLLHKDITFHKSINSSKLIDIILNKISMVVGAILLPLLNTISNSVTAFFILSLLLIYDFSSTLIIISIFFLYYLLVVNYFSSILKINSNIMSSKSSYLIQLLQESLRGIKDVIINSNQKYYLDIFSNNLDEFQGSAISNQLILISPKFFIEIIGLVLIILLFYVKGDDLSASISLMALYALASQRLLPIFQQSYSNLSSMKSNYFQLIDVISYLKDSNNHSDLDLSTIIRLPFKSQILFETISFSYGDKNIFSNLKISIPRGSLVAVIGPSGTGKTTLIDILMGFLTPNFGYIQVDNNIISTDNILNWRMNISHVPQNIFIADDTLASNIALGVDHNCVDYEKLNAVISSSGLIDFVRDLPDGLQTKLLESGARISGGQKQRIGIARALYRDTDLIVFDEVTSALDVKTEQDILKVIKNLVPSKTIIMVTHRIDILELFDLVISTDDL